MYSVFLPFGAVVIDLFLVFMYFKHDFWLLGWNQREDRFFSYFLDQSEASKMKSDQSQDRNLTASQPTNFQVELQQFLLCFHYLLPHFYSTVNGQNLNWLVIILQTNYKKKIFFGLKI